MLIKNRMRNDINKYDEMESRLFGHANGVNESLDDFSENMDYYEDFDNSLNDIDFSNISGRNFKEKFSSANRKIQGKTKFKKVIVPDNRQVIVENIDKRQFSRGNSPKPLARKPIARKQQDISNGSRTVELGNMPFKRGKSFSKSSKNIERIVIPDDRKVTVEKVNKYILSRDPRISAQKRIGYYKGKKLEELVLLFNNPSAVDFNLEIFNPSMPLDYIYSTSQNLNDVITVAGGQVAYTDVLFNLLANSTLIPNAKFVFAGTSLTEQLVQPIIVKNKSISGVEKVYPFNLDLSVDTMQVANDIVTFDFLETINRPFIPDGMDVLQYKILAGMSVTMVFFYEQVNLKKVFYNEAKFNRGLL